MKSILMDIAYVYDKCLLSIHYNRTILLCALRTALTEAMHKFVRKVLSVKRLIDVCRWVVGGN